MTTSPLLFVLFACGAAAGACGDGTTGRRVVLQTEVATDLPADHTFATNLWTVTLTRGEIATGAFYYFEGPPPVIENMAAGERRRTRGWLQTALDWLSPVGTAHAHPGHYAAGRAMGQMLDSGALDLLAAGPTALPDGEGITGLYRSGTFSFGDPADGTIALVEGVAVKDAETVHFRVAAERADLTVNAKDARVVGSTFAETQVTGDGRVTATVHPAAWFTLVNFTGLPAGTPEAPTELAVGTTPRIAFALGLAQIAAYSFAFRGEEAP
jgi:hypothetical protein